MFLLTKVLNFQKKKQGKSRQANLVTSEQKAKT